MCVFLVIRFLSGADKVSHSDLARNESIFPTSQTHLLRVPVSEYANKGTAWSPYLKALSVLDSIEGLFNIRIQQKHLISLWPSNVDIASGNTRVECTHIVPLQEALFKL